MNIQSEPKLSISDLSCMVGMSRQLLHSKANRKNTKLSKSGKVSYVTHKTVKKILDFSFNKKVIAVQHIKGGVGKTTTSDHIGDAASLLGCKVLKIDADFQMNLSIRHGISDEDASKKPVLIDLIQGNGDITEAIIQVSEGVHLLPSRFENATIDTILTQKKANLDQILKDILSPIENDYDLIIFDCPAMLGKLVTAVSLYADMVICPLNPEEFSIKGLDTLKCELNSIEHNYGKKMIHKVFLNKFEGNKILSNTTVSNTISSELDAGNGYDVVIRNSQEIINLQKEHKNLFSHIKKSQAREDFLMLTGKIIDLDDVIQQKNNPNSNGE